MIVIAIIWAICIPLSIICWGLSAGALGHYYSRIATGMNPLVLGLIAGSLAWALLVTLYSAICFISHKARAHKAALHAPILIVLCVAGIAIDGILLDHLSEGLAALETFKEYAPVLYTFLALCLAKGIMSIFLCVVLLVGFFNVLFLAGSSNRENRWSTSLSTLEIERHVLAGPMEKIKSQSFTELAG